MKKSKDYTETITKWIGSKTSIALHTIFFIGIFGLKYIGFNSEEILLILTTAVSLEAIYLAIFIQRTVNKHSVELEEVSEDIDEIQKDVDEIQEDVEEISEDIEDIQEDVDEIQEDVEGEEMLERQRIQKIEKSLEIILNQISKIKEHK